MSKDPSDPLLTVAAAALFRGVSRAAIYAALSRGRLPRRHSKGALVVRQSDLLRWQEEESRGRRPGSRLDDAHKARISAGQKKRWELRRSEAGKSAQVE